MTKNFKCHSGALNAEVFTVFFFTTSADTGGVVKQIAYGTITFCTKNEEETQTTSKYDELVMWVCFSHKIIY